MEVSMVVVTGVQMILMMMDQEEVEVQQMCV